MADPTPTPAPTPGNWIVRNEKWILRAVLLASWAVTALLAWSKGQPIPLPPVVQVEEPRAMGWVNDPDEANAVAKTLAIRVFADTPAGQVTDIPASVYGWKDYEKLLGSPPPVKDQGKVGSCVPFGTNTAIERTLAAEILRRGGSKEEWIRFAEEVTYGGSRNEIGQGRLGIDRGLPNDKHAGSVGAWAAQFATKYGMVPRRPYPTRDLTSYDVALCRQWGNEGVPAEFEEVARQFPVKSFVQVKSWADVKSAVAQSYNIAVCSNQGFASTRDSNGIARAQGNWGHCMCCDGYHTEGGKEYGHIVNSWGTSWISGPTGWGNPGGDGFWAESSVVDRMVRQGDSWAFSGVTGFPARKPLPDWWIDAKPVRPKHLDPRFALAW